ncbi:MAG: hypothetical protein Kow0037_09300 [Calditrichia bacterium]
MSFKYNKHILLTIFLLVSLGFAEGLKVEKIIFNGNEHCSVSELKKILKSQENKPFDNKLLRLDRQLIRNYYISRGYMDIWVESSVAKRADKVELRFNINEGKQYRLKEIQIKGVEIIPLESALRYFKMSPGDVYLKQLVEEGLNGLEKYYYDNGKPYVQLNEKEEFQDSLVTVQIEIQENETVTIVDIDYQGLKSSKSFIIRRELEVKKGDRYSRRKLEASRQNIYSTGLFNYVGLAIHPVGEGRSQVRLVVSVIEKEARWVGLRFGVAYEQETSYGGSFDFTVEGGHRNLFGTGRSISAHVVPSLSFDFNQNSFVNSKNQFRLTYVEPWVGYTRTPGIFTLAYYQVRPLNSANYNYLSSNFRVSHEFHRHWRTSGQLSFEKATILESDTLGQEFYSLTRGNDYIYALSISALRDKRDNYLNPQEGSVLQLSTKMAFSSYQEEGTSTRVNNRFLKFNFSWNRYQDFPFLKDAVLASRIRVGDIWELGKRARIPILERYYLGGASTVRGYGEQLLGPVKISPDGAVSAIGGNFLLLANIEIRFPIYWLIWGEIFTDAGNVWAERTDFEVNKIKTSSGVGFALLTPMGPVRFDYGRKHRPESWEKPGEFHISISFAF